MEEEPIEVNYNDEPVHYCSRCLSLKILKIPSTDYCDSCGCTEIRTTNIHKWEKMYFEKYGEYYIKKKK